MAEVTPAVVRDALAAVQRSGAAAKTRARLHGTLTGLFAYLVERGELDADPLTTAGLERPKAARRLPRYIDNPDDFAAVIAAAGTVDPAARRPWPQRDLAVAAVLAGTAARAGEVCALSMADVVLDRDEPYLRVLGKGNVSRDCPLSPQLVDVIRAYLTSREEKVGRPARRSDRVFLNAQLHPLIPPALDHSVRRWFARAGVPLPPGAAAHAFRHTAAMQLIGLGQPVTVVQDLLGHASLSSTQIYTRAAGRHVREAAAVLPIGALIRDHPGQSTP